MANVLTGFKDAMGTSTVVLFVMAIVVWILLPFAHPVYVVVAVPCIILGVALAFWLVRKNRIGAGARPTISHLDALPDDEQTRRVEP